MTKHKANNATDTANMLLEDVLIEISCGELSCDECDDQRDAAGHEIKRLRAENDFLKSRYHISSKKMSGNHTWIATNHWPRIAGPTIDDAIGAAVRLVRRCRS